MAAEVAPKHNEVLLPPEQVSEIEVPKEDEIVALVCVIKPQLFNIEGKPITADSPEGKLAINRHSIEIAKAGTKPFKVRSNMFMKMPRAIADWHVAKAKRFDQSNPLMLIIKSLEDVKGGGKKVAALTKTEQLIQQLISLGTISDATMVENFNDSELEQLVASESAKK